MAIRVVMLACFLMSINLASADLGQITCIVDTVAGALGFDAPAAADIAAAADVSNINYKNIFHTTQKVTTY